jgi:hypothetical protein
MPKFGYLQKAWCTKGLRCGGRPVHRLSEDGQTAKSPNRRQFGLYQVSLEAGLHARRWHIRAAAIRHLSRHADVLPGLGRR